MMEQPSGLDHSQETGFSLGYLTAWYDAEAAFTLDRRSGRYRGDNVVWLTPGVHFANTSFAALEYVSSLLKRWQIGHHIKQRKDLPQRAPQKEIRILGMKRVQRFLDVVEPYLQAKREHAQILREFISLRLSSPHRGHGTPYSEREWTLMRRLRALKGYASRDPQRLHVAHPPFYPVSGNVDEGEDTVRAVAKPTD